MTELTQLSFPVLRVNSKHIQRFDNRSELVVESDFFLSKGAYGLGTFLIDANGQKFSVLAIKKVRPSYSWKYWGAKHRAWVIAFDLSSRQTMALKEAKDMLLQVIIERQWYLQGDYSRERIELEINSANTFESLFGRISTFGAIT